jgi:broad specificity phosphatase PhoE
MALERNDPQLAPMSVMALLVPVVAVVMEVVRSRNDVVVVAHLAVIVIGSLPPW